MKSHTHMKTIVAVLAVGVAMGLLIGRADSAFQVVAILATGMAMVCVTTYPELGAATVLSIGALLPSYIIFSPAWFPVRVNGPMMVAVLLGVCALAALQRDRRSIALSASLVVPMLFALIWFIGPILGATGGTGTRIMLAVGLSASGALTVVAVAVLALRPRGRRLLAFGVVGAGLLSATYGAVELALGDNPVLRWGARVDPAVSQYLEIPLRFGFRRLSGTMSHPIMLSILLGLAILCVIALWENGKIRTWVAVLAIGFMGIIDLATLSRAPLILCVIVSAAWLASSSDKRARRLGIVMLTGGAIVGAVVMLGTSSSIARWFDPQGNTEAGGSLAYRVELGRSLLHNITAAPLLGNAADTSFLDGFGSLDSQIAYLLSTRGWVGLAAFAMLLLAPLFAPTRQNEWRKLGLAVVMFVGGVSLTTAIFGPVQLYVLCALVLVVTPASGVEVEKGIQ